MPEVSDRSYRRARRDLTTALAALIERGRRLALTRHHRCDAVLLIDDARRVRADAVEVVTFAVVTALAAGHSWTEVAEHLSVDEAFARDHYGPLVEQWKGRRNVGPRIHLVGGQPRRTG